VPALEPLPGLRVVASPAALDRARWVPADAVVIRFAPDEAFAVGASSVALDDPDAIVEPEAGFVGAWVSAEALRQFVLARVEWALPSDRPALAQGTIAGVPGKLWLTRGWDADGAEDADQALLVVQAAYAAEIADRLR
jgi:hypothetical protein